MNLSDIYDLLYRLGIKANTTDFFYMAYAVHLAAQQPERLLWAAQWLYPEVAAHYHTTPAAVARGIQRGSERIWTKSPNFLSKLTQRPLTECPTPARLLSILVCSLFFGRSA
ncbi:MAG: sporulation initiation factor Spo0A C-terminal domain-containing protein [Oscillospiraceae bacterium]|nr:sporulation initiation factor Spo0A C-terminal domain-containing protein [Oscillospiraceae bacterium]